MTTLLLKKDFGGKGTANNPKGVESVIDPEKWITMTDVKMIKR